MSCLSLESISKTYGNKNAPVLQNINFNIHSGEFIILLGESGCGKTTLLRLIAGLEDLNQGKILIDGTDVTWTEPKNREVAMVFQNYALYPHMTVYENMMYPLHGLKFPAKEKDERIKKNADMLKITAQLKKKPGELSGGQRQRVAIGRALVRRPKVFLFDEPLSNLDARLRDQLRLEIAELLNELKTTTVYVTHDQNEAMSLGDRIVLMKNGEISQSGTPLEMYNHPQNLFCAKFLGHPQINVLPIQCDNGIFFQPEINLKFTPLKSEVNYNSSVLCIRPEKIEISPESADGIPANIQHSEFYGNRTHYLCRINEVNIWVDSLSTDLIGKKKCRLNISPESCYIYDNKEQYVDCN